MRIVTPRRWHDRPLDFLKFQDSPPISTSTHQSPIICLAILCLSPTGIPIQTNVSPLQEFSPSSNQSFTFKSFSSNWQTRLSSSFVLATALHGGISTWYLCCSDMTQHPWINCYSALSLCSALCIFGLGSSLIYLRRFTVRGPRASPSFTITSRLRIKHRILHIRKEIRPKASSGGSFTDVGIVQNHE